MRISAEIKGLDLVQGMSFYGETYADEKVIERIGELYVVLSEVFWELSDLHYATKNRSEMSACEINEALAQMRKDLLMIMAETEDIDNIKKVLYELGEKVS